jgi:molecular chaperone Hsp33
VTGDDVLIPFQTDRSNLRGRLIRLGPVLDTILHRHEYPEPVARLLAEALALAALLGGALKYEGVFTLQAVGKGAVKIVVADYTSTGGMRGYAQFDRPAVEKITAGMRSMRDSASVSQLLGGGHLAFTVDQGPDTERYQGIVAITGATLTDCVHHYFRQSEQLETLIRLCAGHSPSAGGWRAGGIMCQRLPVLGLSDEAEDDWRRTASLVASVRDHELLDRDLMPDRLLYRLLHEEGVRTFEARPVADRCRCSRERVMTTLRSIAPASLEEFKIDGRIVVTCEFCNTSYPFSESDLAAL